MLHAGRGRAYGLEAVIVLKSPFFVGLLLLHRRIGQERLRQHFLQSRLE